MVGEVLAELERRLPYGLVADDDAAGGQHLLDHAQAERKRKYSQTASLMTSAGKRWPA